MELKRKHMKDSEAFPSFLGKLEFVFSPEQSAILCKAIKTFFRRPQ